MKQYLVATVKPWNLTAYEKYSSSLPGEWHLVTSPQALNSILNLGFRPRYIFFPHWSWKVPTNVLDMAECVCFHSSDVPFGRGGSPIQNLIARGHNDTVLSALRMIEEVDAGPVYTKRPFSLSGSGQEIFTRLSELVYSIIEWMVYEEPQPQNQIGEPIVFQRRKPEESVLPTEGNAQVLYDHIRMLDLDTYPRAFCLYGNYRLEFKNAKLLNENQLHAEVEIRPHGE